MAPGPGPPHRRQADEHEDEERNGHTNGNHNMRLSSRRPATRHNVFVGFWGLILLAGGGLVGMVGCSKAPAPADVSVTWTTEPSPPVVGAPIVADVTLRDADRQPVRGATIEIEGHMTHPGMAPVLAAAEERGDGVYRVRFQFTMAGDWIVLVKGFLPDGRPVNHRIDVASVRPSG